MASEIRDIRLAASGEQKIEWVKRNCDLLRTLEQEFLETRPFAGKKIALSVHLEAKTAYLCKVLAVGGAQMYVTGSNPRPRWRQQGWRSMPGTGPPRKSITGTSARYCAPAPTSLSMMAEIWFTWYIRN